MKIFTKLTTLFFSLTLSTCLMAVNQVVTSNGDSGAGTLRQAIIDAGDGDEITFNLASGSETITIISELGIAESLTINGANTAGSGTAVTIQVTTPGTSAWRVFYINTSDKTITINNMTIKGGDLSSVPASGGGIMFQGNSILNLNYVNIVGSKALWGGGIYAYVCGTLNLSNCSVYGNTSSGQYKYGGGIALYNCASSTIQNSSIYNNSATGSDGGGIAAVTWNATDVLEIINSTIFGNVSTKAGGADNYGRGNAGGLSIRGYKPDKCKILNSTISGNSAEINGGGLYLMNDDLTVKNTLIGDNTALSGADYYYNSGTLTDNGYNIVEAQAGTATGAGKTFTAVTNITGQQANLFGTGLATQTLADNNTQNGTQTLALLSGSVAINLGTDTGAPATDQRGASRNGTTDIGAYEFGGSFLASAPEAQAINLYFSTTGTSPYNIVLNYTASGSAEGYLIVRKTGSAPTFVPSDETAYTTGTQGSDEIIYVGTATTAGDNSVTTDVSYYYKIYAYNGSGTGTNYLTTNPLSGNAIHKGGSEATLGTTTEPTSSGFPGAGITITFPDGSSGTTLNVTKTASAPSANFQGNAGVRGMSPLYFTITSTSGTPGNYTIVLDFSSLGLTQAKWERFKVMKRADASSNWTDITGAPNNATIISRQTDGVWGKFTISGLSSFSEFGGGEGAYTVISNADSGAGTLRQATIDAGDGDVIEFDVATMGSNTITLASTLVLNDNLTIVALGSDGGVILDGNNAQRVLDIADANIVTLKNLKIQNGADDQMLAGGVWNNGNLTMINCVVSNNVDVAFDAAGGIIQFSDTGEDESDVLTLINCTITNNDASDGTGGLYAITGTVNIYNTIIYGNTGFRDTDVNSTMTIAEAHNSCIGTLGSFAITSGSNNISSNPLFVTASGNATHPYALSGSSPCADVGNDSYNTETTDIKGDGRKLLKTDRSNTGTIDIGAYEYAEGGKIWNGSETTVWDNYDNWTPGGTPNSSDNVIIPNVANAPIISATTSASCNNLTIESGATLTINSNATNNGSLIVGGTSTGNITYNRYMTGSNSSPWIWHLTSSPVAGQALDATFMTSNSVATDGGKYGLAPYNNSTPGWAHYVIATPPSTTFTAGKGYEVARSSAGTLAFTGTVATADVPIGITTPSSPGNAWNLVGNPYPSALCANTPARATNNLISVNTAVLDAGAYQALYVWDADAGTPAYITVNHSSAASYIAPGQAFFVYSVSGGGNFNFTEAMQTHQTGNIFKSGEINHPAIQLIAERTQGTSSTNIKYIENMTTGLDPGYDGGRFNAGDNSFAVYTHLVGDENNTVDFDIQCLPSGDFDQIIPVGLNAPENTEVVFRAEAINLPTSVPVYLEDKATAKFTALHQPGSFYNVTIAAKTEGTGRFFLHTKSAATGIKPIAGSNDFMVITRPQYNSIRVLGSFENQAEIAVYDMAGRKLINRNLNDTELNDVDMGGLISGFYLVSVSSPTQKVSKKISWIKN